MNESRPAEPNQQPEASLRFEVLRAVTRVGRYRTSPLPGDAEAVAAAMGVVAGRNRDKMYGAFCNRAEWPRAEPEHDDLSFS